jgi:hydroxyacylglutathione hydrolase
MEKLNVKKMELGPIGTNAFLLWEEGGKEAVLVDAPPSCSPEVKSLLEVHDLSLGEIWLTHGHWDHIAGVEEVIGSETKISGHRADKQMFENPSIMSGFALPGVSLVPVRIDRWVENGDVMDLWGREVRVLHCPGHCPGNVAFYLSSENLCFVGDVIFSGSVGRTDLPGGDFQALENSIKEKIYTLPDDTELAVGHGPNTKVGREKMSNPYVRR